jgi:uncharacterized Ntn-hydrolase superfamily protein
MTFSLVGRCAATGMVGVAVVTSSIAVGARCPHVRARTGAVATQNITDPALGPLVLDHIAAGHGAEAALARALEQRPHRSFRQLAVVDRQGRTAHFTGERILGRHAVATGDGVVAAGNLLASEAVPRAMVEAFAAGAADHLAERLIRALEAGLAAGGEEGPVHSAALLVADAQPFPLVDLRIDWDDAAPIDALRRLWSDYRPQMDAYLIRALDPEQAPSYGVAGDQ